MSWHKVKPKKQTPISPTTTERPLRMKITPEESLRRMQSFGAERAEAFVASVRGSKKPDELPRSE